MKYKKMDLTYIIRLERGERIVERLLEFCEKEEISAGYFNGLGAASKLELGHFDLATKNYTSRKLSGQYEITSLHGNISTLDNKSYIHAHITVGDEKFNSSSGHLKEAIVSATCEIFLVKVEGEIRRKKDEETGLNLLDI
jgi:hypothetical protein